MRKRLFPEKPKLLISRRAFLAAPAILLADRALAQVGQIATWPPKNFVAGGGGFAPVSHTAIGSPNTNTVTTSAISTTGADFIVVGMNWYSPGGTATLSDSASNTWTPCTIVNVASGQRDQLFYVRTPTTSGTHTFTATGTGCYPALYVASFSGSLATPLDKEGQGGSVAGGLTSIADASSVTPTTNNQLVITMCGMIATGGGGTITASGGFTVLDTLQYLSTGHYGGGMAYLKQTTAAAVQPTWSWTGTSGEAGTALATFKFS